MKKLFIIPLIISLLTGCVYTNTFETGNKVDESKISLIQKGKTTEKQLIEMFGEPQVKTVLNDTDVKMIYMYTQSSASAQMFTGATNINTKQITLDILLRNGIVINHALQNSDWSPKIQMNQTLGFPK